MRAQLGLVVLFVDLPDRALRKCCKVRLTGILHPFHFDQDTGQVICLRHKLDIKAPLAGFPVRSDVVAAVHHGAKAEQQTVIKILVRGIEGTDRLQQELTHLFLQRIGIAGIDGLLNGD